jgi:drug/metabolite transporter (DMT)-like permease
MQTNRGWKLEFVALGAIWGASFLFTHLGVAEFGALPTAGVRVSVAALCLLPLLWLKGQMGALRAQWRKIFFLGLLNSGIPFALYAFALLSISTGLSSILNATVPLFGTVVAWLWLGDRPHGVKVLGLLTGFAGIVMLTLGRGNLHAGTGDNSGWAILACLGACLCYGLAASFTKKHLTGVPSLAIATGSQVGAALGLAVPAAWLWPSHTPSTQAWLALVAVGVLCTGVAYVMFFRLIERVGAANTLTVTFLIPVFAVVYGVLLLGERVTPWMLLCGAVILAGTALSMGVLRWPRRA